MAGLRRAVQEAQAKIDALQIEEARLLAEAESLWQQIHDLCKAKEQGEMDRSELVAELQALRAELEQARAEAASARACTDAEKAALLAELARAQEELEAEPLHGRRMRQSRHWQQRWLGCGRSPQWRWSASTASGRRPRRRSGSRPLPPGQAAACNSLSARPPS